MRNLALSLAAMLLILPALASAAATPDLEARRKALHDLLQEQWDYTMRTHPIYASFLGDKRFNDQIEDLSQKAIDDDLEQTRRFLARFEAIDAAGFPKQEVLNRQLMVRDLKITLEGALQTLGNAGHSTGWHPHRCAATGQHFIVRNRQGL
jgi:uncharacterized protein (DUF885 family)